MESLFVKMLPGMIKLHQCDKITKRFQLSLAKLRRDIRFWYKIKSGQADTGYHVHIGCDIQQSSTKETF